jgi:hypothetical protein
MIRRGETFQRSEHLVLLLWLVWLTFEHIAIGSASVMYFADNVESFVPPLLSRQFAGIEDPLWDRFTAAGIDHMTLGYEVPVIRFLFDLLPGWLAHGVAIAANYAIATIATYVLAGRTLGVSRPAAVFAAVFYSVFIPPQLMMTTTGLLPLLILAIRFVLERPDRLARWAGLVVTVLLMAWTTYFSQLIPYASIFVFLWFVFVDPRNRRRDWAIILLVSVAIPLLRVQEFLALFAVAPLSQFGFLRTVAESSEILDRFLTFGFVLDGPTRLVAAALMVGALFFKSDLRFRLAFIAALVVLAGGLFGFLSTLFQELAVKVVPFLSGYTVQYFSSIGLLALGMGGAVGVHVLGPRFLGAIAAIEAPALRTWVKSVMVVLVAACVAYPSIKLKYANALNWVTRGTFVRNFQSPVLNELAEKMRRNPLPERVEGYQIASAVLSGYGFETLGGDPPLYYRRYYEYWAKLAEPWARRALDEVWFGPRFRQIHEKIPGDPVFRGARLMFYPTEYAPEVEVGELYRMNMMSLANVAYMVSRDRLVSPALEEIRGRRQPWSALNRAERASENVRGNFRGFEDLYVYRNTQALLRFFAVSSVRTFDDGKRLLDAIAASSVDQLHAQLFVEKDVMPDVLKEAGALGIAEITLEMYTSDEIRLAVRSEQPSVLVASNSYSPFWKARIDGREARIFPAYHAFWGLYLPAGSRQVVFRFEPPYAWK